jgi:hypothetical protein
MFDAPVHIKLLYTPGSYLKIIIIFLYLMIPKFFFQRDFRNSKGKTRGKPRHVSRDVQKSVEEGGKRNEHNCVTSGAIPTTMCIRGM